MKQRKACHQIFEKIKCEQFYTILDQINDKYGFEFNHLILREHIFTFDELKNFDTLMSKLKILHNEIESHFHHHKKGDKCKNI